MLKERFPNYENQYQVISKFTKSASLILVSSEHGNCLIAPDKLLRGVLPHIKNAVNKSDYFVSLFKKKHNNKYSYPDYEYEGPQKYIRVNCALHGDFIQKNYVHLMGSGCQECADGNRVGGYSRSDFIKNAKGRLCTFYLIKCSKEKEIFYKIGITMRPLKKRFGEKKRMPYKYEIIVLINEDASPIYNLEKEMFKKYKKDFSYRPKLSFHGESECFDISLPIAEIIQELKSLS